MQKLLLVASLTAALALPATAGGPVLVEDEFITEARPSSEGNWILPVAIGLVVICALACGGDTDTPAPVEPPKPVCFGGC